MNKYKSCSQCYLIYTYVRTYLHKYAYTCTHMCKCNVRILTVSLKRNTIRVYTYTHTYMEISYCKSFPLITNLVISVLCAMSTPINAVHDRHSIFIATIGRSYHLKVHFRLHHHIIIVIIIILILTLIHHYYYKGK